jgi:RNA polymerase sigma-70 factor (ECF subfamily)
MKDVNMEELELIQTASQGDLTAFNELVLKYQDQVFNLAHRILGNQDTAADISQEVFILAFRQIYQFRGGSFRAWLLKTTTNLCYSEMRTWKRVSLQSFEPTTINGETYKTPYWTKDTNMLPEESVENHELRAAIEHGLSRLQINYRNAVTLVDIQQLNYKDAAFVMGIPVGTLKSRLTRGRMQLGNYLTKLNLINTSEPIVFEHAKTKGEYHASYIG